MNLGTLIYNLKIGVARDDLNSEYKNFVNQALIDMQQKKSWSFQLNQTLPITIAPNQTDVELPNDFKEFAPRDPVWICDPSSGLPMYPADLIQLVQMLRLYNVQLYGTTLYYPVNARLPYPYIGLPVALRQVNGLNFLTVGLPSNFQINFQINYYRYLPPLEKDEDSNFLTEKFPYLVLDRAKYLAFKLLNDPAAAAIGEAYDKEFETASKYDTHLRLAGRRTQM